jgi:hypothetical protein
MSPSKPTPEQIDPLPAANDSTKSRTVKSFSPHPIMIRPKPPLDVRKLRRKEIVEAWENAGASVGWMRVQNFGLRVWGSENTGVAGDLPAFSFHNPNKRKLLAHLPAPEVGFALNLSFNKWTEAELRELANLMKRPPCSRRGARIIWFFNFSIDWMSPRLAALNGRIQTDSTMSALSFSNTQTSGRSPIA